SLARSRWSVGDAQPTARVKKVHTRERVTGSARLRAERRGVEPHGFGSPAVEADQLTRGASQQEARPPCAIETEGAVARAVDGDRWPESRHLPSVNEQQGGEKVKVIGPVPVRPSRTHGRGGGGRG